MTKTIRARYTISARYFYYSGTSGAPKDGPYHHQGSTNRISFDTRAEAEKFLREDMGCLPCSGGAWSAKGTYVTHHGEYERPEYHIVRIK